LSGDLLPPFNLHLDLARGNGEGHSFLRPYFQALFDGFMDVPFRLGLRLSLADTAGDGGTIGDEHAVFILEDGDEKFHF